MTERQLEWRTGCGVVQAFDADDYAGGYSVGDWEPCVECDAPVDKACVATVHVVSPTTSSETKLCESCGQPMLKPGQVRESTHDYRHARGCPEDDYTEVLNRKADEAGLPRMVRAKRDVHGRPVGR